MDYPVIQMLLPANNGNHPNKDFAGGKAEYITVHETANPAPTADAKAHGFWVLDGADYAWHETADDRLVVQHLLPHQQGWHAGDGYWGPGNQTSWAIELCVAKGMNFARVREIAAHRIATLMNEGHGYKGVVQHNRWTGKNCPTHLRSEPGAWDYFISRIQHYRLAQKEHDMTPKEVQEEIAKFLKANPPIDARLREVDQKRFEIAALAFGDVGVMEDAFDELDEAGFFDDVD